MTQVRRRSGIAGCAAVAAALLLASCTSNAHEGKAASRTPSTGPSRSATAAQANEKRLTDRAQAALTAVHSGGMVEAGAERVTDGIHTEPHLTTDKTYHLSLVCYGSGSARLTFKPASAGTAATVPCDQSVVQQRITAQMPLRVDLDAAPGATGVVAWQIDAMRS
ncbi:hypothetical protein [Streptomyces sp. NPDC014006]|uniref:hypothetical protein n=1 Tax=Streptomyces sp. NPDC014006 TaxID=3364870 RepID=UPI0036FA9C49